VCTGRVIVISSHVGATFLIKTCTNDDAVHAQFHAVFSYFIFYSISLYEPPTVQYRVYSAPHRACEHVWDCVRWRTKPESWRSNSRFSG